jgi:DNA-binding MarR family transcriptional regulator
MADRLIAYRLLIADVYELAGASRRSSDRVAGEIGQTAARWHVLSAVSDEPHTVPAIARRLGLTRQSVQRVVTELADIGSVTLRDNPAHARSPLVELTGSGRACLDELFARSDARRGQALERADLSASDLLAARAILRKLIEAVRDDP